MGQKTEIIIVDDERLFRTGISLLLRNFDINTIGEAENGDELILLLNTKKPDVILLDLEMPILNGSQTMAIVRDQFPQMKIIIFSKYYDEELIKDIFNRGANAYLSKNSPVELVCEAIRRVVTYGIYRDNIPCLLKNPALKDGHYYKLIFTKRELGIINLLCESKSYKDIGLHLFISAKTVENHAKSIFKKVNVKNRAEFGILAIKKGLNYLGE